MGTPIRPLCRTVMEQSLAAFGVLFAPLFVSDTFFTSPWEFLEEADKQWHRLCAIRLTCILVLVALSLSCQNWVLARRSFSGRLFYIPVLSILTLLIYKCVLFTFMYKLIANSVSVLLTRTLQLKQFFFSMFHLCRNLRVKKFVSNLSVLLGHYRKFVLENIRSQLPSCGNQHLPEASNPS